MIVVPDDLFHDYPTGNDTHGQTAHGMRNRLCMTAGLAFCYSVVPITAIVASFGIFSNLRTFLLTIRGKPWGHRLSYYVQALCLWDTGLLIGVLALKAFLCLHIKQKPIHLWSSEESLYVLFLGALADLCVTGSTWVMVAITAERYMAVSRPFRERTRNKSSVKWISSTIVIFSMAINLPRILLDYFASDCVNSRPDYARVDPNAIRLYAIFGRIIPDLLFRSPTPIVISIFLTFKIVKHCRKRLSRKVHTNLLPNASNDSAVHSASRTANIKSPLMLAVLNGKFLACNSVYIGTSAIQWLDYWLTMDSTSSMLQTLQEFSGLLLVIHGATNWLFFRKWHVSLEPQNSVPDYEIFDAQEKVRLTSIWAKIDVSELGTELLLTLFENNTSLIKSLCPHIDDSKFDRNLLLAQPRVTAVGARIGQFIERMMKTLNNEKMKRDEFMEIRTELRSIGIIHFIERVKMTSHDWHLTKKFLVDRMLEHSESGDSREDEEVANKFASFVIHEMKNGYVCESARTSHQGNGLSDRDYQTSGRASPVSEATNHIHRNFHYTFSFPAIHPSKKTSISCGGLSSIGKTNGVVSVAHEYIAAIDARSEVDDDDVIYV